MQELSNVRFLPWVGKNYEKRLFFGKKILVLGESHNCGKEGCTREECESKEAFIECRNMTNNTMKVFFERPERHKPWMNTYTKFERSLFGEWTNAEDRKEIWDAVAFYNYLQYSVDGSRKAGEDDAYEKAIVPFYQVIDFLKPEVIIVWGQRLWYNLPGDERWEECDSIKMYDGYNIENGFYKLSNGDKAKVFQVNHPSSGYTWEYWHKVIKTMLQ